MRPIPWVTLPEAVAIGLLALAFGAVSLLAYREGQCKSAGGAFRQRDGAYVCLQLAGGPAR